MKLHKQPADIKLKVNADAIKNFQDGEIKTLIENFNNCTYTGE